MRDEKLHAAVARSRFGSRNAKNTSLSENFWMLRCSKSACCCSAKYIAKSKSAKHTTFGALLEVEMSKKCAQLWREAHVEVKMLKAPHVRNTFGRSIVILCGGRNGFCTFAKNEQNVKVF